MIIKEYKTIDEQLKILESRGVKFKNKKKAKNILKKNSYFDVINGFESILLNTTNPKTYKNIYF